MIKRLVSAVAAMLMAAPAFSTALYQQDFESGSSGFTGGSVEDSVGYAGLGFGSRLLRSSGPVSLSFDLAQDVRGASLSLSLGIIDSWDDSTLPCCGPDRFKVTLDGQSTPLFDAMFDNFQGRGATTGPGLTTLAYNQSVGFNGEHNDAAYTLTLALGDLSAGVHTLSFTAYGDHWQDLNDESFGLDNVTIAAGTAVPEPGSLALAALGLGGVGLARRRRPG